MCLLPHICPFSQALALETWLLAAPLGRLSKLRLNGALPGLLVALFVHTVPSQSPLRLSRRECCSLSPLGSRRIKYSRLKLADTNKRDLFHGHLQDPVMDGQREPSFLCPCLAASVQLWRTRLGRVMYSVANCLLLMKVRGRRCRIFWKRVAGGLPEQSAAAHCWAKCTPLLLKGIQQNVEFTAPT